MLRRSLGEAFDAIAQTTLVGKKTRIAAHERESKLKRDAGHADESTLFFDDQKVPVETIAVANPEVAGLASEDYEVIGEKVTHRLAQRPEKLRHPEIRQAGDQAARYPGLVVPGSACGCD